jgi:hypothetical protein
LHKEKHLIIIGIMTGLLIFSSSFSYFIAETNQAFARCPNGYHKSPSGDCEKVVPHEGLPRCPNGYHRSPDGDCEAVGNTNNEDSQSSNANTNEDNSSKDNNNDELSSSSTTTNLASPSSSPSLISPSSSSSSGQKNCDQSLWQHVYNPNRLQIVNPCMSVTGTIDSIRVEKDGDYHIRLKVDPQFSNLINSANIKGQYGDLVLEPICQKPVKQPDAIAACANFHQSISIPPVGTHVNVTGSYVLDKEHGRWAEIHPVTSIIQDK